MSKRPVLAPSLLIMFVGLVVLMGDTSTAPRAFGGLAIAGGALFLLAGEIAVRRKR